MERLKAAAIGLVTVAAILLTTGDALACRSSRTGVLDRMFAGADVIVRATAEKYTKEPPDPNIRHLGTPEDTIIEFKVEEVLRGVGIGKTLLINGYLSEEDDYNEYPVPYTFVRKGGRGGNCFAFDYRKGAQFLLFLKKTDKGYTPNVSSLGPNNEQLLSEKDAWLLWVREEVANGRGRK